MNRIRDEWNSRKIEFEIILIKDKSNCVMNRMIFKSSWRALKLNGIQVAFYYRWVELKLSGILVEWISVWIKFMLSGIKAYWNSSWTKFKLNGIQVEWKEWNSIWLSWVAFNLSCFQAEWSSRLIEFEMIWKLNSMCPDRMIFKLNRSQVELL